MVPFQDGFPAQCLDDSSDQQHSGKNNSCSDYS
jgi:hypothetical protein